MSKGCKVNNITRELLFKCVREVGKCQKAAK
jgi:hypothetical protein